MSRIGKILEEIQNPKKLNEDNTKFVDKINDLCMNFDIFFRDWYGINEKIDSIQAFIKKDGIKYNIQFSPESNLNIVEQSYVQQIMDILAENSETIKNDPKVQPYIVKLLPRTNFISGSKNRIIERLNRYTKG